MTPEIELKVRKPDLSFKNWSENQRYYFGNNVVATHIMNSLHVIVPVGERFFIRSVRAFAPQTVNEDLKARLKIFFGQENIHDKEHVKFWQVLREQGLEVDLFDSIYQKTAFQILEPAIEKLFGKKIMLATTVALEHYTASLASEALRAQSQTMKLMPGAMKELMTWHAIEELEHKAIAFDLLEETDSNYALRVSGFLLGSIMLNIYTFTGFFIFLWSDKQITFARLLKDLYEFPKMILPMTQHILPELLMYFQPGFHPDDIQNENLIAENLPSVKLAF